LRGLLVGGVVAADGDGFRDLMRDVMKARDCGSVIFEFVAANERFDVIDLMSSGIVVVELINY